MLQEGAILKFCTSCGDHTACTMKFWLGPDASLPPLLTLRPRWLSASPPQPGNRFHVAPGSSACSLSKWFLPWACLVKPGPYADTGSEGGHRKWNSASNLGGGTHIVGRSTNIGSLYKKKKCVCCRHGKGHLLSCGLPWAFILRLWESCTYVYSGDWAIVFPDPVAHLRRVWSPARRPQGS